LEDEARLDAGAIVVTRRAGLIAAARNPTIAVKTIAERMRSMVIARVTVVSLGWSIELLAPAEVRRGIAVGGL
jgi:hypothetical protein